ncbi:MAG: HAMP domain-containing histidine kinase [Thermoproteota archaeon]|nr:HAMP domain-containing histidine kinase [Thermoproteota archaeon]
MTTSDRSQVQKDASYSNHEGINYERTEMLIGPDLTTKQAWEFFSNASSKFDTCASSATTSIVMTTFRDAYEDMKRRGVKIRYVADITKDNLKHSKDLMQYAEVRHISHLNANFAVSEREYILAPTLKEGQPLPKLIFSNSKEMVEQQQNVFDIFWDKAVPAEQRIKAIEEDREEEFFQVINNPERATEIYVNLAKSVKSSALLLLPSSRALIREYKLGLLEYLIQASRNKDLQDIRIVCSIDDSNAEIIGWMREKAPNIKILNNTTNLATKIFVVNYDMLFRVELRDPDADTFSNAFGFAIYSNNKHTVDTFKSFFELVWHSYETNEKLQQADKAQREFINVAAHELRTPIVPILNVSELLYSKIKGRQQQREEEEGQEQQKEILEMLEVVLRNAEKLHQLTEDILDVTRIESNTLKLRKERFNLNDIIVAAVEDCRKQIKTSGNVKVMHELKNCITLIEADRRRLRQVISNLLNNAVKFTNKGSVIVSSTIKAKDDDYDSDQAAKEVIIAVKDTGTGIDAELMPKLFTKFTTKSYQGTGLGLYISKSIIEAHGGKMWAENNNHNNGKQQGATFYFTLPLTNG